MSPIKLLLKVSFVNLIENKLFNKFSKVIASYIVSFRTSRSIFFVTTKLN